MSVESKKLWKDFERGERRDYFAQTAPDCSFLVGDNREKISSHKWILSEVSPVFERMFNGDFKEASCCEAIPIDLPDEDPEIFRNVLNSIYFNKFHCDSSLVHDDIRMFKVAQKYMMTNLIETITEQIEKKVKSGLFVECELIQAFELAHTIVKQSLIEQIEKVIQVRLGKGYVRMTNLINISYIYDWNSTMFLKFIEKFSSYLPEILIFKMIERYATTNELVRVTPECDNPIDAVTNKDLALEEMLDFVNFRRMTAYEFVCGPGESNLFSDKWKYKMLIQIIAAKD